MLKNVLKNRVKKFRVKNMFLTIMHSSSIGGQGLVSDARNHGRNDHSGNGRPY